MHVGADIAGVAAILTLVGLVIGGTVKVTRSWSSLVADMRSISKRVADHVADEQRVRDSWQRETMARIRHDERRITTIERAVSMMAERGSDGGTA